MAEWLRIRFQSQRLRVRAHISAVIFSKCLIGCLNVLGILSSVILMIFVFLWAKFS